MSVNGIELAVGQKWRTRCGEVVVLEDNDLYADKGWPFRAAGFGYTAEGKAPPPFAPRDLVELVTDEHGWTPWKGGGAMPFGGPFTAKLRSGDVGMATTQMFTEEHLGTGGDMVAYRLTPVACPQGAPLDRPELWHMDWSDAARQRADQVVGETISRVLNTEPAGAVAAFNAAVRAARGEAPAALDSSAQQMLAQAAKHMADRAATYDKPAGERSMSTTVAAFNAVACRGDGLALERLRIMFSALRINLQHNCPLDREGLIETMQAAEHFLSLLSTPALSESEGWLLMALLKIVRDRQRPEAHRDSLEDLVAYGALYGEARLKEGGTK